MSLKILSSLGLLILCSVQPIFAGEDSQGPRPGKLILTEELQNRIVEFLRVGYWDSIHDKKVGQEFSEVVDMVMKMVRRENLSEMIDVVHAALIDPSSGTKLSRMAAQRIFYADLGPNSTLIEEVAAACNYDGFQALVKMGALVDVERGGAPSNYGLSFLPNITEAELLMRIPAPRNIQSSSGATQYCYLIEYSLKKQCFDTESERDQAMLQIDVTQIQQEILECKKTAIIIEIAEMRDKSEENQRKIDQLLEKIDHLL